MNAEELGLVGDWAIAWNNYTNSLQRAHIQLFHAEDKLIWGKNEVGATYSAKQHYAILYRHELELGKVKAPTKSQLFLWLVLKDKVLTWEMMRKRHKKGPGICILGQCSDESTTHLLLFCSYSQ